MTKLLYHRYIEITTNKLKVVHHMPEGK